MAATKHIDVPPLNEGELQMLRDLLFRYAAYHTAGWVNAGIDLLLRQIRVDPKLIEQPQPTPQAAPPRKRRVGKQSPAGS